MEYSEEDIREAVDIAIGDDGYKSNKVIEILKQLRSEQSIPKVGGSLHWISDRLTSLSKELKEYTESGN